LGKLSDPEVLDEAGWEDLQILLEGSSRAQQLEWDSPKPPKRTKPEEEVRWELVKVQQLRVERTREFGQVYLGLALWHRLGLERLLNNLIEPGDEEIPWATVAGILSVARFCGQPSELGIAEHWYEHSALEDLTGISAAKINDDRLYRGLDVLGAHKDRLCEHLLQRYRDWFGVQFEFLLYDVTSTFFEGQALANPLAARGYSRDNRSDCKQVCIGLVCTPEGLPLSYEVFAGNRADVTTVEEIVSNMEDKYGQAQRIWVMDRGMVSEENIQFLRQRQARYLVGTPKSQLKVFEAALLDQEGWKDVQSDVQVKLLAHPDGKKMEQFVLCRSSARAEKERAMLERQRQKLQEELQKMAVRLRRRPLEKSKDIEMLQRRIGRWQGKYPAAAKILEIHVVRDEQGRAVDLQLEERQEPSQWAQAAHGAYLLRTNCTEEDPVLLWRWYIQLTQAEAAFRTAKSDLGLRPIYHQKPHRVQAHILVCFLALAMWRTLEQWMRAKGLGTCARRLIAEISTIKSMDVVLPVRRGEVEAELRIRTVARPEPRVAQLLHHLDLRLPQRNRIVEGISSTTEAPPSQM
jgi:transposase